MFVGFCDFNQKLLIAREQIIKMSMLGSVIRVYYNDVSAFTGQAYIDEVELEYSSEEKAKKNWNEFIDAAKSGAEVFFFDSDAE